MTEHQELFETSYVTKEEDTVMEIKGIKSAMS